MDVSVETPEQEYVRLFNSMPDEVKDLLLVARGGEYLNKRMRSLVSLEERIMQAGTMPITKAEAEHLCDLNHHFSIFGLSEERQEVCYFRLGNRLIVGRVACKKLEVSSNGRVVCKTSRFSPPWPSDYLSQREAVVANVMLATTSAVISPQPLKWKAIDTISSFNDFNLILLDWYTWWRVFFERFKIIDPSSARSLANRWTKNLLGNVMNVLFSNNYLHLSTLSLYLATNVGILTGETTEKRYTQPADIFTSAGQIEDMKKDCQKFYSELEKHLE